MSPIQIQILIFLSHHPNTINTPSYLAKEFNVTKATITDSVRVITEKGLVLKEAGAVDKRSYTLHLTTAGKKIARNTENFSQVLLQSLQDLPQKELDSMLSGLYETITSLNKRSIISVQRMCRNCRFFEEKRGSYYCKFLNQNLSSKELRIDCPEFEQPQ